MLAKLVYEDIKAVHKTYTFGRAKYGGIEVIVLKEKGYINATNLCSQGGKRYSNMTQNETFKDLIKEVSLDTGLPALSLSIQISGNQSDIKGTYIHQDLIVHVASWVSPKFAIKVSKIVNNFSVNEHLKEVRLELLKKEGTIKTLEDKVDQLLANSEYMRDTLDDVRDTCKDNMQELDEIKHMNEILLDNFLPSEPEEPKIDQLKITLLDQPITEGGITYSLYIQKGQRMSLRRQTLYKGEQILLLDPLLNGQNLFNQIKRELTYASFKRCLCKVNGKTLHEFLEDVVAVSESRYKFTPPPPSKEDLLKKKTMADLVQICKTLGYKGYSYHRDKHTLVNFMIKKGY